MLLEFKDHSSEGIIQLIFDNPNYIVESYINEGRDTLTIIWNRGTTNELMIDDQRVLMSKNDVIVLGANQSFRTADTSNLVFWRFNRKFYCIIDHDHEVSCVGLLFYGHQGIPIISLDDKEIGRLELLYRVFHEEYQEPDDNLKGEMLRTMLKRLIVKLTRLFKNQMQLESVNDAELDLIRNFNLLVEQHFRDHHQVQDYSSLIHKSPKTISNLFSKHGGRSPLEVIHERLLIEAKRLLLFTSKTTKEIAYEIGFKDIPTFSRFFKKQTNMSPSNFRKEKLPGQVGKN